MPRKSTEQLADQAANASTPEKKLAALVTLEATEPEGILDDPETVLAVAENLDGAELAKQLDALTPARPGSGVDPS